MKKFLTLEFLPVNPDFGLLVLRLWFGISMLWLHGAGKFMNLINWNIKFSDPFGIGQTPSFILAVFAEAICPIFVVLGLFTRLAALFVIVTMAVAFFIAHGGVLKGQGSGEMAFVYLAAFVVIFIAGAGKFSFDKK